MMRTEILIAIIIGALAYSFALHFIRTDDINKALPPSTEITNFEFNAIDGRKIAFKDINEDIIILNFWASWCAPCIKEFPALIKATQEYPANVKLIALSSDEDEENITRFLKTQNISQTSNIIIAHDKEQKITKGLFKIHALPKTYLIDSNKEIFQIIEGGAWNYNMLKNHIEMLLGSIENHS